MLAGIIAALWSPLALPALLRKPDPDVNVFDPFSRAFVTAIPVAATLGWLFANRVVASRSRRVIVGYGMAVLVTNALVVSWALILPTFDSTFGITFIEFFLGAVLGGVQLAAIGLLYVGWLAAVPAMLSAAVWGVLMRRIFATG